MASSSAFDRQPWEEAPDPWDRPPDSADSDGSDAEESDHEGAEGEEAGEMLAQMLLSMVWAGKMSAKTACVIAWWASRAGAKGPINDLAYRPSAPSGHFSRKVDNVSGIDLRKHKRYLIKVPATTRFDHSRSTIDLPLVNAHEAIESELADNPGLSAELQAKIDGNEFPQAYDDHPVRRSYAGPVLPLAIFMDGVQFNKRSGMLAIYLYNLVSGVRHMLCAVRKSELCACGCRGWCSLYAILSAIKWSLVHLALKLHPSERHDREAWNPGFDDHRASVAGTELAMRCCLLFYKGDWAEYCHTFGLAGWGTRACPCPFCKTTKESMLEARGYSLLGAPAGDIEDDDYFQACRSCEIVVALSAEHHAALKPILFYDRRQHGNRGRCLTRDYAPLGLRTGDRLEPCEALPDIGTFESLEGFPIAGIVFWRRSNETRVRHRCPLLDDVARGLTILRCQIDIMHTIWLGVAQDWIACVLWMLLLGNCFGLNASLTEEELVHMGTTRLRADIMNWYSDQRALGTSSDFTPLEDLPVSLLGEKTKQKFKAKAAETKTILPFIIRFLRVHFAIAPIEKATVLLAAGEALMSFCRVISATPVRPRVSDCQSMLDEAIKFFRFCQRGNVAMKPKHHLMLHMPKKALTNGHPNLWATWMDETLNRLAASIGAVAHRMVWPLRVLAFFEKIVQTTRKRPRGE